VRRLFRQAPARQPARRLGLGPESSDPEPGVAGGARAGAGATIPGPERSAPAPLGRLPRDSARVRVLAGSRRPFARAHSLRTRRAGRLAQHPVGAVARADRHRGGLLVYYRTFEANSHVSAASAPAIK